MKLLKPTYKIETPIDRKNEIRMRKLIRTCYKFVPLENMNGLTLAFLRKQVLLRKQEFLKNKFISSKVSTDTSEWVVQANSDHSVSILAPLKRNNK